MARRSFAIGFCMVGLVLLLGGCGGEKEPAAVAPVETASPEPAQPSATEAPPAPAAPDNLAHEFTLGTHLLTFEEGGPARNPVLAATEDEFRWGALVSREGQVAWVVDGVETPIGHGELSEFVATADLSRHAYVSNDVVVVDGEQVAEGTTSCCPVFSRDGTAFGYIADGSFAVLDGAPQETHAEEVSNLVLSDDGSGSAYVVGGNTVVVDGEKQARYDSVTALTLSPDGSRIAYIANGNLLVEDGEELDIGETTAEQITFSPDGSRLAYVKGALNSGKAVLDEKEQKKYPFGCASRLLPWGCLTLTSDGSSLAYTTPIITQGGVGGSQRLEYRVVRDGQRATYFLACCLVASPVGSQMAYISTRQGLIVDGQPVGSFVVPVTEITDRTPADLVYSPDGRSLGFLVYATDLRTSSVTRIYLDTVEVP